MDNLQQFYPIFSEAISAGRIDTCQWIESGETIETAVPELYDLVSHKRIWRAIIVCSEHEDLDTKYPADFINPFDFKENANRDGLTIVNGELVDCEAPIIRLTHLLGGIPTPEPKFEATLVSFEDRTPRVEYHPINNEETEIQKQAYLEWSEAHKFQGLPPAEIILIKVRKPVATNNSYSLVRSSWDVHTEADSSEFWKRNLYPHNCRFLVYDMDQRGVLRRQQDLFKLWLSILLIAENNIDPNVLQAHRLYSLNILLNEDRLADSFQQTINRLNMAKYQIEKSIAEENEQLAEANDEIPDYSVGVPVSFQLPKVSDIHFDPSPFGLTGGIGSEDMAAWERYSAKARNELQTLLTSTDRTLDYAAGRLRENYRYSEPEVVPLTKYQEEDFTTSLDDLYKSIIQQQENLPNGISDVQEQVSEKNSAVKTEIIQRMTTKQVLTAGIVAACALIACLVPGLFNETTRIGTGVAMLVALAAIGVAIFVTLLVQRKKFIQKAKDFQMSFQTVLGELSHNAGTYSDFLSGVASHMRGKTYLNIMKEKQRKKDSSYYFKQTHLKSIEILLGKLSLWSSAMHIKVDLKSVDAIELVDEMIDYDELYSFSKKEHEVPLNQSGATVKSPYSFVEQLIIEREEVYDNARSN